MNTSPTAFRNSFLQDLLDLLWRRWTALGVSGTGDREETRVIDPEALLLLTLTVARHDPRLFDGVLDWLLVNGSHLNIQRLQNLVDGVGFESGPLFGAVADLLDREAAGSQKWKNVAARYRAPVVSSLFLQDDGSPWPTSNDPDPVFLEHGFRRPPFRRREQARNFPSSGTPALLLRLRALLGISLRCEILCILGSTEEIHPSGMAKVLGQSPRALQLTLADMARSGAVRVRKRGREKVYSLVPGRLDELLRPDGFTPWENSVPLFRALEILWLGIIDPMNLELGDLTLGSQLRRLAESVEGLLDDAGYGFAIGLEGPLDSSLSHGSLFEDVLNLLRTLES